MVRKALLGSVSWCNLLARRYRAAMTCSLCRGHELKFGDTRVKHSPSVDVQAVYCTAPRERSVGVNRSSCRLYASPAKATLEKASQHRETALSHNWSSLIKGAVACQPQPRGSREPAPHRISCLWCTEGPGATAGNWRPLVRLTIGLTRRQGATLAPIAGHVEEGNALLKQVRERWRRSAFCAPEARGMS